MVWTTVYDEEEENIVLPSDTSRNQFCSDYLDHLCEFDISSKPSFVHLSGIICTIGTSSQDIKTLERMMAAGMNIARLEFTSFTHEWYKTTIQNIRTASENYSRTIGTTFPVAIALDTKGPEIRTGILEKGVDAQIELRKGEKIKVTTDKTYYDKVSESVLYVDYENIHNVMDEGYRIFVDNGAISLLCNKIKGPILKCTVEAGGILKSKCSVNLPGTDVDLPVVSEKDKKDLCFAVEQGFDMVFASFIRDSSALKEIRDILGPEGAKILVIAKIENHQGMMNIDEIIKASDGIMIGRGDLGTEVSIQKLFLAQKSITAKCNKAGKPVICANQLLYSMMKKRKPTMAERSDVTNAILDGVDCVMLTGESAKGKYPVECIETLVKLSKQAESVFWHKNFFNNVVDKLTLPVELTHTIAISAIEASINCLAAAIIVETTTGRTAYLLSKYKPRCPVIAITRDLLVARQAHLFGGVLPLFCNFERLENWTDEVMARLRFGICFGQWKGIIKPGDAVVLVHSLTRGSEHSNSLQILRIKKQRCDKEFCGCKS